MKSGSTAAACAALFRRDLTLIWRRRGDALNPILFALIVVALFPLALGPEPENLRRIAAGFVFVALLLACKIAVHWLTTALPLLLVAPLLAEMLNLPRPVFPVLLAALALATPLLSLIGAVCVALTVGMRRSGMLLALLVLPLYVPVLIFGAGACNAAQAGFPFLAPLLWLGAGLVLALVLAPLASAAALKISLS